MTKQSVLWGRVAGFSVMVVLVGCVGTERMPAGKSLYDRLGGKSSIPAVVDQFVANVAADTRINGRVCDHRYSETLGPPRRSGLHDDRRILHL